MEPEEVKMDIKSIFDFFLFAVGLRDFKYKKTNKEEEDR
jgi:hypothetical protein